MYLENDRKKCSVWISVVIHSVDHAFILRSPADALASGRAMMIVMKLVRVPKKTKQICFCQNFVKFPPISIIFGRKMGNDPNICEVPSFSTSPNLCHHLTVLNANVSNCYITPKLLVIDRSHWRPQIIRGRRTFRGHSNFRQFVHIW